MFWRQALGGLALGLALATAQATALEGTVTQVIDGDSLVFQSTAGGQPLEVRLDGIDAPEGCQAGGPQAREALAEYVRGKTVQLQTKGLDSYKRTLAVLSVEGMNINERMVAEGQAWSIRFKWDKGPYVDKERMAKALKRGVHATTGAVMPKDFRRSHGPCAGSPAAASAVIAPAPAPAMATTPVATAGFRCDGRTHCSQMTSCAEATWFLSHCPGVKMDGNRDGVPCERQWCGR